MRIEERLRACYELSAHFMAVFTSRTMEQHADNADATDLRGFSLKKLLFISKIRVNPLHLCHLRAMKSYKS